MLTAILELYLTYNAKNEMQLEKTITDVLVMEVCNCKTMK